MYKIQKVCRNVYSYKFSTNKFYGKLFNWSKQKIESFFYIR